MNELLKEFKQYLRENEESYKNGARDSIEYPLGYEEVKLLSNEIERLNKRILTLEETIKKANNNVLKDVAMIKTHEMVKQEIVQRLIETSRILEENKGE